MLVPAMNMDEIRKEVYKDFPCIYRKAGYVASKVLKNFGPIKDKVIYKAFDYCSPSKNKWIYSLKLSKSQTVIFLLAYFYNQSGLHAYGVFGDSDYLLHFDKHFFERYNERENLGLPLKHDVMQTFVKENFVYSFHKYGEENGVSKMFYLTEKGMILGDRDDSKKVINARTYLPYRLLTQKKVSLACKGIKEMLDSIILYKPSLLKTIDQWTQDNSGLNLSIK